MGRRIAIARIGQLTGDTENGIWNVSEAWPLMLSTVDTLGCLPHLKGEKLGWLPVDVAAKAVCEIALASDETQRDSDSREDTCPVYHLVANITDKTSNWSDLLSWVQSSRKESFEVVAPILWLNKLRGLDQHPAQALLGLWDRAYGSQAADGKEDGKEAQLRPTKSFDTTNAETLSGSMRSLKPIDKGLVVKIWKWLEGEMEGKV